MLASEKSRATDATSKAGELEEQLRRLQTETKRQAEDLSELREHNESLGAEREDNRAELKELREALARARGEHGASARELAGLRESASHTEQLLRSELTRCLTELESAIGARESAEAAQRESRG